MAPPQYGDLGKSAKDIFNKGYSKREREKEREETRMINIFYLFCFKTMAQ